MTDYRAQHDPLCRLLKRERCSGIGGLDWGHYLDQPTCRNCGARCDCERVREIRAATYAGASAIFARTRDQWIAERDHPFWSERVEWAYGEAARVLAAWAEDPTVLDKVLAKIEAEKVETE